jgi:hypothetical protein
MQMQAESDLLQVVRELQSQLSTFNLPRQREWHTVEQFAELVNREPFTVREWCRHGRIHANKKGRGPAKNRAWAIPTSELLRFEREGLLPIQRRIG